MATEIPVYVFCGFLEGGKTRFIEEILRDPDFTQGERTLILQCEEGIEELSEDILLDCNATIVPAEDEKSLDRTALAVITKKIKPDRIIVEYNGMWPLETLMHALPRAWTVYQIVTVINAATFELYSQNIGAQMFEHITTADLVVFNRCTDALKEMLYRKNIRAMNPRATIFLDDLEGNTEDYVQNMPLPFDLSQNFIEIADEDFGLWYIDASSEPQKYQGKTVRFKGRVYSGGKVPQGAFVPGRAGMVCCADDITLLGFLCRWEKAATLELRSWVMVTASVTVENLPQYRGEGPVLNAISVEPVDPPTEEIVYFS